MTALNFVYQNDVVSIAMDTLSLSPDTHKPRNFLTKFYPVPHLVGVICGTGVGKFIAEWAARVQTNMLVKSIPHLNEFTQQELRNLWPY